MKKISIFSIILWLAIVGFIWYNTHYIVLIIASPLFVFMMVGDLIFCPFEENIKDHETRKAIKVCTDIVHVSYSFVVSMYLTFMGTWYFTQSWLTLSIALFLTIYTCAYVFVIGSRMREVIKIDNILYSIKSKKEH